MTILAPPQDFEGFRIRLASESDRLPRRLKEVAGALLNDPDDAALSTVAQLSEKIGVQPSTLVRFAQVLGFRGFSDLQTLFRNRLRETAFDHRARITSLSHEGTASLFDGFAHAAALSFERARETLDPAKVEAAVTHLASASTIYLIASGRSFSAGAYAAYAFGALGIKAVLIDQIGGLGKSQLNLCAPHDRVLAISFAPYASETRALLDLAHRNETPIIAITDHALSPLIDVAEIWLEIAEADYASFRSLSATFALLMALAVATAKKRGLEKSKK